MSRDAGGTSHRRLIGAGIVLFAVIVWGAAGAEVFREGSGLRFGCRLLPNGAVTWLRSLDPACPMKPYERVTAFKIDGAIKRVYGPSELYSALRASDRLELTAQIHGEGLERWVEFPIYEMKRSDLLGRFIAAFLISATGTGLALFLLGSVKSHAGVAAATLSAALTGIIVPLFCNIQSIALDVQWSTAACLLPAALFHFSLVYPREKKVVQRNPGLLGALYSAAFLLGAGELNSAFRLREYWTVLDRLSLLLIGAAWLTLVLNALHERRAPTTSLHRARANATIFGSVVVTVGLVGFMSLWPSLSPAESASAMTGLLMLSVGPITYLVSKSGVTDATKNGYVLMACAANGFLLAGVFLGIGYLANRIGGVEFPFGSPGMFWAVAFVAVTAGTPLSRKVFERWIPPWHGRMNDWVEIHSERMRTVTDANVAVRFLRQALMGSLEPESVGVWIEGMGNAKDGTFEGELDSRELLSSVEVLLERDAEAGLIDLCTDELLDDPLAAELRREGVALVVPLRSEEEVYGVVVVGPPRKRALYTNSHFSRAAELCWQTAVSIQNARLMDRIAAESVAAGRNTTATQMAHDLKSPLRSITMIAARAQAAEGEAGALASLEQVKRIAIETQEVLGALVESATKGDARRIGDVIAEAAGAFQHLYGDRLLLRIDNALPMLSSENCLGLKRVLQNLLDNAFAACNGKGMVEIYATAREGEVLIDVIDEGEGLTAEEQERAFDWGFTTKDEGSGIGLATCKTLLSQIGGRIEMQSAYTGGVKVRVHLLAQLGEVGGG